MNYTLSQLKERYPVFAKGLALKINIHLDICADLNCEYDYIEGAIQEYVSSPEYQRYGKTDKRFNLDGTPVKRKLKRPQSWQDCLNKWGADTNCKTNLMRSVVAQLKAYANVSKSPELLQLIPPEYQHYLCCQKADDAPENKPKVLITIKKKRRINAT